MAVDNKPPAPSGDLRVWADELYEWLTSSKGQSRLEPATVLLAHRKTDRAERASVGGMLMYDQLFGSPIYSRKGIWQKVSSVNYTKVTSTPFTVDPAVLVVGYNIFGISTEQDATINLPEAGADTTKLVVIKNETADFTVTVIP